MIAPLSSKLALLSAHRAVARVLKLEHNPRVPVASEEGSEAISESQSEVQGAPKRS